MPLVLGHELDETAASVQIYNAYDSMTTLETKNELQTLLPGANARLELRGPKLIYDFERALQAPAIEMMLRGWQVDPWARETGIAELNRRLERLSYIIDRYAGAIWDEKSPTKSTNNHPKPKLLNPNSTEQLQRFFYEHMGIKRIVRHKNSKETYPMEREILERLETNYFIVRPIISAILAYRDNEGQLEVLESEVDSDWKMRTTYGVTTTTGRFASSKSITGLGRNMQNIEEDLRYIFVSEKNKKLIGADHEQAETRDTGWNCYILFGDSSYLDSAESSDPHTDLARILWPKLDWNGELNHDKKIAGQTFHRHHSYREAAKRLRHATEKFGQAGEISRQTRIPLKLCKEGQEKIFETYPCLQKYFTWVASQLQSKHYLIDAFGGRSDFFGRVGSNDTIKEGIAFMSQAPTGRRLNLGLWRVWRHMGPNSNTPFELLAQLHDAIYGQRSEQDTDEAEVITEIKKHLDVPMTYKGRRFTVPSEVKVGWCWGNAYQQDRDNNMVLKHPDGLTKYTGSDTRVRSNRFWEFGENQL